MTTPQPQQNPTQARILVTGAKQFGEGGARDYAQMEKVLTSTRNTLRAHGAQQITLIHGGAIGADLVADYIGKQLGMDVHTQQADWDTHGKNASIIRDQATIAQGVNVVLGFPIGESHAARHCMQAAHEAGIPVVNVTEGGRAYNPETDGPKQPIQAIQPQPVQAQPMQAQPVQQPQQQPVQQKVAPQQPAQQPTRGNIKVVNVKRYTPKPDELAFYCGRWSANRIPSSYTHAHMGNPFPISKNATREQVCDQYRDLLREKCANKEREYDFVIDLAKAHNQGSDIVLACHCAPAACHCHVIQSAIEGYADLMLKQQQQQQQPMQQPIQQQPVQQPVQLQPVQQQPIQQQQPNAYAPGTVAHAMRNYTHPNQNTAQHPSFDF